MQLSPSTGTYVLVMRNVARDTIVIGKYGKLTCCPGFYVYVGSAFGPGGIRARIRHHSKIQKHCHWHIDYLRQKMLLLETWYSHDLEKREHQWARLLQKQKDASIPMPGFGSSDCRCISHLYFFPAAPDFAIFKQHVKKSSSLHTDLLIHIFPGTD